MKKNIARLAIVAYNGQNFKGSQIQKKERTVQGEFQKVLNKLNINSNTQITSRTDQGVHAYEQGICFEAPHKFRNNQLLYVLNRLLPSDLQVRKISYVSNDFNPRKKAIWKMYEYKMKINQPKNPIDANQVYYCENLKVFDQKLFDATVKIIQGHKSFHNFTAKNDKLITQRTILDITCKRINNEIIFKIYGLGFLRYQVRYIIGAIIAIQTKQLELEKMKKLFDLKVKNNNTFLKAPAQGLYLAKVIYE